MKELVVACAGCGAGADSGAAVAGMHHVHDDAQAAISAQRMSPSLLPHLGNERNNERCGVKTRLLGMPESPPPWYAGIGKG